MRVLAVDPDCPYCSGTGRVISLGSLETRVCGCFRAVEIEAVRETVHRAPPASGESETVSLETFEIREVKR